MTAKDFDPDAIKKRQQQDWDMVSAGWEKWWDVLERGARPVSERLIALAELEPGKRVLDIATGIGEPQHPPAPGPGRALRRGRVVHAGQGAVHQPVHERGPGVAAAAAPATGYAQSLRPGRRGVLATGLSRRRLQ